ncbi:MAG: cytosine permease [Thermoplasmata archaeon]
MFALSGIGIIVSIIFYNSFYQFFENFLYVLDYWIMPWAGVMIADYYLIKKKNLKLQKLYKISSISALIGFMVSIPFQYPGLYEMPMAKYLGGVDISYFISFFTSMILMYLLTKKFMSLQQS